MQRKKIERIANADKIAAGEVVERPANVVKELVENSIDAGAKEIRIILKNAGKTYIQVIDDGIGIPPEEIELAFERFTSSKIRGIEDLDTLATLGFRGEALPSIAAVSKVDITSRIKDNELGTQLVIEGGKIVEKKEVSSAIGTNMIVKNLFFNIPARQKFLKSDSTELGHITDFIQRYALAYPNIHFIYLHNDLAIINAPTTNDLKTTVYHIYGKETAKLMVPVDHTEENSAFKIYGVLGHPQMARKNRTDSSLFLNRRYVLSDILFNAIKEAYEGTLMVGKNPFFVLNLELNPSEVDFNIHPQKLQIRFEKEDQIYNKVYNIVRNFVEEHFIAKEAKYIATELDQFVSSEKIEDEAESEVKGQKLEKPIKEIRSKKDKKEKIAIEHDFREEPVQLQLQESIGEKILDKTEVPESCLREKYVIAKNFPKLRLVSYTGQLSNKIYVLLEGLNEANEPGLYILDQHAASERVNKEYFSSAYETTKISKQMLISPLKIDVSPSDKFFLEENTNEIKKLGFDFESFGGNTFILRNIPTIMQKVPNIDLIKDIISDIAKIGKDKSFFDAKEEIINYLACHRSIRGGDDMTLEGVRNLLLELSTCKDPFHCAHGRPTLKFISFKELDKLFKRIV